uniref:Uncharacterized protein n=1 Tax=Manihot esculenta TaxID=3983 RepID=A0A2C9USN1_MANES
MIANKHLFKGYFTRSTRTICVLCFCSLFVICFSCSIYLLYCCLLVLC